MKWKLFLAMLVLVPSLATAGPKRFKRGAAQSVGSAVGQFELTIDISADPNWTQEALEVDGFNIMNIITDANFDTSNIEVHCAFSEPDDDNNLATGTYVALTQDDGSTAVIVTSAAASKSYSLTGANAAAAASCRYIRLKSTTTQTTQDTVLYITLKG